MIFKDYIQTLLPLEDFGISITLKGGESCIIENKEGKKGSLQLLQNHLGGEERTAKKFPLENFCEFHEEWKQNPDGHHTTIAFLDRYNREGGTIKRI